MLKIQSLISIHQKAIGIDTEELTEERRIAYAKELVLALQMEIAEFMQELPWKSWKKVSDQKYDLDRARNELVDVFIFAFDLWNLFDFPQDLRQEIVKKIHYECY